MSKRIITISREFGSGGRTIGKKVADRLGIAYYDKELVEKIAQESGLSPDFIEENGEYASATSSFLFSLAVSAGMTGMGMSLSDQLYTIQHNIITDLAKKEPCVIVGRCSDYILRNYEDCLHVFIYADTWFRADRIVRLYGERDCVPEKRLKEKDSKRKVYYKHYTGRQWGVAQNYDICLNSGVVGIDECVEIITKVAREA